MGAGEAESWERPRHRRSGKASPPQSRLRDPAAHGHAARIGVDVLPLERLGRLGRKLPRGQHPSPHLVPADTLITVLTNAIVTPNTSLAASCRGDSGHEFNSIRRCCGVGGGVGACRRKWQQPSFFVHPCRGAAAARYMCLSGLRSFADLSADPLDSVPEQPPGHWLHGASTAAMRVMIVE